MSIDGVQIQITVPIGADFELGPPQISVSPEFNEDPDNYFRLAQHVLDQLRQHFIRNAPGRGG